MFSSNYKKSFIRCRRKRSCLQALNPIAIISFLENRANEIEFLTIYELMKHANIFKKGALSFLKLGLKIMDLFAGDNLVQHTPKNIPISQTYRLYHKV